jgi:regulator of replication initiation timing
MALTAAERQANAKTRKEEVLENLTKTNEMLISENQKLQLEVKNLTEKMHRMEISALKAQLKKA